VIPNDFIAQLLSRVDVVEVIDRHVPLKKAGQNYQACCPFHKEKSPSFSVSPSKQFYHCFGCGAHGSAITFLMEYAGKSFPDAVEELAQGIGLAVPRDNSRPADPQAGGLFDVMQTAAIFYKQQLKSSSIAIEYFRKRGVSGDVAKRFHLGWAPAGWQPLADAFEDYADNQLLETAGLIATGDGGKRYDRFRERVMFPILNQQGVVIAFGGRILGSKDDGGGPKYLNSPETPIFSKGRELYGLFQAQAAIRKINRVLVVEGYMDVVALAQYGVEYVVATLGTATTDTHTQRLLRLADEVVFSFDGDSAGQRAAWRALENALPALRDGKQVRFLFLPPEHDPDSYIREFGREAFEEYVASALPLSKYWIDELNKRHPGDSAEAKAARAAAARLHLEQVSAPMMRESLAKVLEGDVDIASHTLLPPVKAKPAEAATDGHRRNSFPETRYATNRPPIRRHDPMDGEIYLHAQRIVKYPILASQFSGLVFPHPNSIPHSVRVLAAISDYVCSVTGEVHRGVMHERFSGSEFQTDVDRLTWSEDEALVDAISFAEAESQLRSLRYQIESGDLFGQAHPIPLPQHASSVAGIVGLLGTKRNAGLPPPPGAGGVGERGAAAIESSLLAAPPSPSPLPLSPQGRGGITEHRLRDYARELRTNQTPWEQELWQELRAHRFADVKFRRQQPIGPYVVDFVALAKSLVIELDGSQHSENANYDRQRDAFLQQEGFRVIRIWNNEWTANRAGVLDAIWCAMAGNDGQSGALQSYDEVIDRSVEEEGLSPADDPLDDIPFDFSPNFAPPPDDQHDVPF
jgi:DNA primase